MKSHQDRGVKALVGPFLYQLKVDMESPLVHYLLMLSLLFHVNVEEILRCCMQDFRLVAQWIQLFVSLHSLSQKDVCLY